MDKGIAGFIARKPAPILGASTGSFCTKNKGTVRRETGKEYGVKVSDDKDLASHIGPKPCVGAREGGGEASVGECTGRPLSLENYFREPTDWSSWKATRRCS